MVKVDALGRELRQALRGLARAPGFTLVAVITLALGIGASSAIYTLLSVVVLEPLPYPAAERLVQIDHPVPAVSDQTFWSLSTASYAQYLQRSRGLAALSVYWPNHSNVRIGERAMMVDVVQVSANIFGVLGGRAEVGRVLLPSDDQPDGARVGVLSHGFWQRVLGGDSTVVGRTIDWNGTALEIVGVTDAQFKIPEQPADLYVARRVNLAGPHVNWHHLRAIGRRASGVTHAALQAELADLTTALPEVYPEVYGGGFMDGGGFHVRIRDLRDAVVGDAARMLWVMLGCVVLVLVIAAANVANLFLVRNETRHNEMVIRSALGASRRQIFGHALSEALLITAGAGVVGLMLAHAGLRMILVLAPSSLPRVHEPGVNSATALFVSVIVVLTAVIIAFFPVLRRSNWSPLKESSRTGTASRRQLSARAVLVTTQIALAVVLLSGAGLMIRTFDHLRSVDSGVETNGILEVTVNLPSSRYSDGWDASTNFWRNLTTQLEASPGVQRASTTSVVPFMGPTGCAVLVNRPSGAEGAGLGCVPNLIVTPGYFETFGIPVRGRAPTWHDVDTGSGAIVVSRSLAERIWPGEDAIGRLIRVPNMPADEGNWYEIVGVADDVHMEGPEKGPTQIVYYPIRPIEGAPLWSPRTAQTVVVRVGSADPLHLVGTIRQLVRDMEPGAALSEVQTMDQVARSSVKRTSFIMTLIGTAGFMALVLSIVGLYGLVAYNVGRRRAEIGIRIALGAHAGTVSRLVMLDAVRLGAIGVIIGLLAATLTTGALRSLLFGVQPTDGLTLSVVALLLLAVTAVASIIPARRAARIDPAESLKG